MTASEREKVKSFSVKFDGAAITEDMALRLADIEVNLTFDMPGMFIMRFEDDDLTILKNNKIKLGQQIEISVPKDDPNDTASIVFKGEVTAIEPVYERGMRAVLNVRGYDFAHRLAHGTETRMLQNSKDSDVVSTIAGDAGLTPSIEATTTVHDQLVQYNQTNYEFLTQLARRNGYKFYVDKDKKLNFKKAATTSGSAITLTWGENLLGFYPRMSTRGQVSEVIVRGWDSKNVQAIVGSATTANYLQSIGGNQKGGNAYSTATTKQPKHYEVHHGVKDQAQADAMAQAILNDLNSKYVTAEGVCLGNADILPGGLVKIEKVDTMFAGTYKVTSVRHIFSKDGFETEFAIDGMRPETVSDLVSPEAAKPLSNQLVNGVAPAIVTNNTDPEDKHRVRVKYPWLSDDVEGWWARVATIDAGNGRGTMFMPEVNDEVLVAFEHGDISRPYVVGSLYNGNTAVPEPSVVESGKVEKRIMKTRAGHIIRLTDKSGEEKIEIFDSSGKNSIVIDTANKKMTLDVGGKVTLTLDEAGTKATLVSNGTMDLTANGNVTIKTGGTGNMTLDAGSGNVDIKGGNINISASMALNAKASTNATVEGGLTTVKANGILTVQGSLVNIN